VITALEWPAVLADFLPAGNPPGTMVWRLHSHLTSIGPLRMDCLESGSAMPDRLDRNAIPDEPERIGPFWVLGKLGEGAFGKVFLAQDAETGQLCALKVLKRSPSDDEDVESGFRDEIRLWLAMEPHPHVVSALRAETINGRFALALEFITAGEDGVGTLQALLERRRVGASTALRLISQICEGLQHAQRQGLVAHRDIKPGNILIDSFGDAKVSDFGLAGFSSSRWKSLDIQSDTIAGSPAYMAPEQFFAPHVDFRADIYSVGIVAYQLLSGGDYPYDLRGLAPQASAQELMQIHLQSEPRPLAGPEWDVVRRCLAKDPTDRPQTYDALIAELGRLFRERTGQEYRPLPRSLAEAHALMNRGASFMLLGEPAIALELTAKASQLAPGYPKLEVNKGSILAAMGDYSSARRVWQSVVRMHPDTGRAHYNLGNLYLRAADYTRAVECYDRCITAESDYVPAWINKAIALTELGQLDLADNAYETAVGWSPGDAQVHYNYGVFLFNQGLLAQAKDALLTCLQLDPRHKAACNYLGNCEHGLGSVDAAKAWYRKALAIDPGYSYARSNLANLG
jgi:tetratricopeptide (TPR) repeat protein